LTGIKVRKVPREIGVLKNVKINLDAEVGTLPFEAGQISYCGRSLVIDTSRIFDYTAKCFTLPLN